MGHSLSFSSPVLCLRSLEVPGLGARLEFLRYWLSAGTSN